MIQNSAKRFDADFSFANVFVAVEARAQRRLRIVHMHNEHAFEAHRLRDFRERAVESGRTAQIMPHGEEVSRVHADAQRKLGTLIENSF